MDVLDDELGESVTVLTDIFDVNFLRGRHLRSILPLADVAALFDLLDVVVLFDLLDVVLFDLLDVVLFDWLDVVVLFDLVECPVTGASVLDADDVLDEPSSDTDSMASKTRPSCRFTIDSTNLDADLSRRSCCLLSVTDDGRGTPAELERLDACADLPFFDTCRRLGPFLC